MRVPDSGAAGVLSSFRHDLSAEAIAAGLTTGLLLASVGFPIHLASAERLGLTDSEASSWFVALSLTSGLSSLALSLIYRQPIQVTITLAGWVFLASTGTQYTLSEIAGAGIATGLALLVLGISGVGTRLMRWLPLPIVLGVFAGSVLDFVLAIFERLGQSPFIIGIALVAFLLASAVRRPWLPPVGAALIAGMGASALTGDLHPSALQWEPPVLQLVRPTFDPGSMLALSLPLVAIAFAIGNIQGLGFLTQQGYRPPINLVTAVTGVATLVNAVLGSLPSSVGRTSVALVAGEEAGPRPGRYTASVIAAICMLLLGLGASSANSLVTVIPAGLIASVAGLAIIRAVLGALDNSIRSELQLGAFFAFLIAASPLEWWGIGSAFWGLLIGVGVSLVLEHGAFLRSVRANEVM